ncbi:MAG TPA: hydrolase [Micromonosporaceae bacterium]|nr:hydrolase [Micromonosporaceae bacterium]HCU48465.1 hydrolase [Micromonosporaceae bacterium]
MRRILICLAVALPLIVAVPAQASPSLVQVQPKLETPALFDDEEGGDADVDDPAIWVHPTDKSRSRIVVTAKNGGLYVYDLRGKELQHFSTPPDGRFNNVDLYGDVAVVTDRGLDKLRFYRISDGVLTDVTSPDAQWLFSTTEEEVEEQTTGYGLAIHGSYAVVTRRHTPELGLFKIVPAGGGYTYVKVDSLTLPSSFTLRNGSTWTPCLEPGEGPQAEGMTVDPLLGVLYVAQEDVALWRVQLLAGRFASQPRIVERVKEFGVPATFDEESEECVYDWAADPGEGGRIAADVEGLTIYRTGLIGGTLLVSSQGDDTFYTYDRLTNRPLSHVEIVGVQECDGAAVVSVALPGFPNGLLVVHDGQAIPGSERPATNVKYVDATFLKRHR